MFVIAFVLLTTYLTQLESNKLFLKPEWRTQKKMSIQASFLLTPYGIGARTYVQFNTKENDMDYKAKRDTARNSLNAVAIAAQAKYGDNAASYMSGYLESAMVEAMCNMSVGDFYQMELKLASSAESIKPA